MFKKILIVALVVFSALPTLAQDGELPNLVAKNSVYLTYKQGASGQFSNNAVVFNLERFLARTSILTAHGLRYGIGQTLGDNWGSTFQSNKDFFHEIAVTNYIGAFRHFLVLDLGVFYNPNVGLVEQDPISSTKFLIQFGYKYHKEKTGLYWSLTTGNLGYLNAGLGFTF